MEKMDAYSLYIEDMNNIKKTDEEETQMLFVMFDKIRKKLKERNVDLDKVYSKLKELGFKLSYKQTDNLRNSIEFLKEKGNQEKLIENIELLQDYYELHRLLVEQNLGLVPIVINKEFDKVLGNDFMDLIQEGNIALSRAVENFDLKKGVKFSTYAYFYIKGQMINYLFDNSIIRKPKDISLKINKMHKTKSLLYNELGREPSLDEISREMREPIDNITYLTKISESVLSIERLKELEEYYEENELYNKEKSVDNDSIDTLEEIFQDASVKKIIKETLDKMIFKDKLVICLYYQLSLDEYIGYEAFEEGMLELSKTKESMSDGYNEEQLRNIYEKYSNNEKNISYDEIGKILRVSGSRISQIADRGKRHFLWKCYYHQDKKNREGIKMLLHS